jgi:signal transduction histidine kinase/DNA-binding response OmpR family regulator/CHASE3 domain sensor protein
VTPTPSRRRVSRDALRGGLLRSDLPPKTRFGFALATLAVFLIALLSYRALQWRAEGARLVSHTIDVSHHVDELLSAFKDAETGQRGYLLTGIDSYLRPWDDGVAAVDEEQARLRGLLADNPAQLERLDRLRRFGAQKLAELKQTIDLRRAGQVEQALAVVRTDRGQRSMDAVRAVVVDLKQAEQVLLDQRTREWESAAWASLVVVWTGSGLLLFLIVGAATMSARDFRAQRIEGWLRAGQSELALAMQGVEVTEVLGDKVATWLGQYLDAPVGAVYVAAPRGGLRRVGGYALPRPESPGADPAASATPGAAVAEAASSPAGLTREAFIQNALIETRDVPSDFFAINSGLGRTKAAHLVTVPLTADGRAFGVAELGFLRRVAWFDLDLLRRLGEPVGLALRATKDRADLRAALDETQRQAQELQSQQEELRVQNEELEQQSRALQESQVRLENQQAELEQINSHLEEQTNAVERQRDDLARAQAELQRSSAYKSEFLANMSHELRTPLNSSLIMAKLLADNRPGNLNAEQIKFAETIYSAGNDLLALINDILDLSKVEAGRMDVHPEPVAIARLCDELGDVFRPVARDKGIDLSTGIDVDVAPTLVTDATRLQQILRNLLSNALKFTERGGVALRVQRAGADRVAFQVNDTGIGIAPEKHEAVFEAFRQADGTTNRKYGGTGLGLSISRDLARLLGGELTLASAPGRGSTFTLTLPREVQGGDAAVGASAPAAGSATKLPPARRTPASPAAGAVMASSSATTSASAAAGRRTILVIEDDASFAGVLKRQAEELDFQVLVAATGDEGIALAEQHLPSAIVLDVGLPDRSGLSVLDTLKHRAATRHIPVHMISIDDHTQVALEMGAAGYALKPVQRDQLVGALRRLETKFTQRLRRILLVEDDTVARDSTSRLLQAPDVEVVAVGTASDALDRLRGSTFDCMVLDLSLPDRNGFDLLDEMSRTARYAFPPVIVYTGRSLSRGEEQRLRKLSHSIIIKGARSPERLLDEVTLFLHQVESDLPADRQRMLREARDREAVFDGRRILIAEDDVRNIFALSSLLEPRGAKLEIARNGREAVERLVAKPGIDLVLMDVMMPEMDGLEAMRQIRQMPEYARLPIIALTAKAMSDDREACLAAGASDYIAKPLDIDKLLSLLRVWIPK